MVGSSSGTVGVGARPVGSSRGIVGVGARPVGSSSGIVGATAASSGGAVTLIAGGAVDSAAEVPSIGGGAPGGRGWVGSGSLLACDATLPDAAVWVCAARAAAWAASEPARSSARRTISSTQAGSSGDVGPLFGTTAQSSSAQTLRDAMSLARPSLDGAWASLPPGAVRATEAGSRRSPTVVRPSSCAFAYEGGSNLPRRPARDRRDPGSNPTIRGITDYV